MDNLYDTLKDAMSSVLANVHTITIAKITAVNEFTINAKPVINRVVDNASIELPEFIEIPAFTLQGGGSSLSMPIAVGDYCILLITERCFDRWYAGQDFMEPLEMRMFDYSDAIALVGINNKNGLIAIPRQPTLKGDFKNIGSLTGTSYCDYPLFKTNGESGDTGTFTSQDGKTITVKNGIITNIS